MYKKIRRGGNPMYDAEGPVEATVDTNQYPFTIYDFMQLAPIFIAVFMLMTSLFNKDFKGFIWLVGLVMSIAITMFVYTSTQKESKACPLRINNIIPLFSNYQNLSLSSFFIMFTLSYLVLPMAANNNWNYYAVFGFLLLFGLDAYTRVSYFCISYLGIFLGSVIGILCGVVWYTILSGHGDAFIYYNTSSINNVYCSRPKKQQFKCNVYKNGEMISSL